ncbi:MAG: hypothetical protein HY782_24950 [Chloroflexi bacterium]|nr:hypothetical protein [Chloroflexota bacterium]
MIADSSYPDSPILPHELREPREVLETARGTGLEHFAKIRPREFRVLGLVPKSDVVAATAKIKKKIKVRGLTLTMARRVIENWEYQRRSPEDERCVERYARIDGKWYLAVVYVPGKKDIHRHNSLATAYRIGSKHVQARIENGQLKPRK